MAIQGTQRDVLRGRKSRREGSGTRSEGAQLSMTREGRIQKATSRGRGRGRGIYRGRGSIEQDRRPCEDVTISEARDVEPTNPLCGKVLRTNTDVHACSELSLHFITLAGLDTTGDTNTITLNLMDHFLFSEDNWLPELSYCKLHAACFCLASLITGQPNTTEQIAASLGEESTFVQQMAAPLTDDEESAMVLQQILGVSIGNVEEGYTLLYDRLEELVGLIGDHVTGIEGLPKPRAVEHEEHVDRVETEKEEADNLDVFHES